MKKQNDGPLGFSNFEIYMKFKRLIKSGNNEMDAMDIIAQLTATNYGRIKKIVEQERSAEESLGETQYREVNRGNLSDNRL